MARTLQKSPPKAFPLLFISLILCFRCTQVFGQESEFKLPSILPPSPNSAELGRYGDIPVNYSTGALNLSVPLHTLATKNLSLPISVGYASNGFRVNAIASRVGFNWVLNAGGVITRTVYGEPDLVHSQFSH